MKRECVPHIPFFCPVALLESTRHRPETLEMHRALELGSQEVWLDVGVQRFGAIRAYAVHTCQTIPTQQGRKVIDMLWALRRSASSGRSINGQILAGIAKFWPPALKTGRRIQLRMTRYLRATSWPRWRWFRHKGRTPSRPAQCLENARWQCARF